MKAARGARVCLMAAALAAGGCVTEVERPASRGVPVGEWTARKKSPGKHTPAPMPTGPVATPAPEATTSSRVRVAVAPMGTIAYDGLTLPIVSPDGRFIAAQQGSAPTWEAILADQGAIPPKGVSVVRYEVGAEGLTALDSPALPYGCILGRDADTTGFLVEWLRDDGSRWIGKVAWVSGAVEWLVEGDLVNAHGAFLPGGALAWTRRARTQDVAELVVRGASGPEHSRRAESGGYAFAMPSPGGQDLGVLLVTRTGVSIELMALDRSGEVDGPARPGGLLGVRPVSAEVDLIAAYQAAAPIQPSAWCEGCEGIIYVHTARNRVNVFRPRSGVSAALPAGTIAAVEWPDAAQKGWFCTTPKGLVFVPESALGNEAFEAARVLAGPFVPRLVKGEGGPALLLFGPSAGNAARLEVVRMTVGGAEAPGDAR